LKATFGKNLQEQIANKEEQLQLNEILCAENCVARWLWKNGLVEITPQGLKNTIRWDLESVNTCPENY
jgi:hypothetical protein